MLWRIHAASALLVVPQFTVATFALVYLVDARGWMPRSRRPPAGRRRRPAGRLSRLGAGYWSDRVGSRMRPMRILAVTPAPACSRWRGDGRAGSPVAVPVLLACGVVAVSTNGLAFTAVAEYAGSAWAGRALGIQNTGQNALAAATPPVLALAIGSIGFGGSFAVVAVFPLVRPLRAGGGAGRRRAAARPARRAGLRHPLVGGSVRKST